ncbi:MULTISPECIES: DUF6542 domain-containing protein [Streptomyces]|uniref:DUF6542 domain-containing protein n=1 Tax=Streptomyces xanthii TaxID=2768069 RepID=A0A7H1B6K2_9ACTN|nr:DUF6542 domain-containing protein [Streptomyces xanthii]QNS04357.1 hypothetical protein IAG42_12465 [Streptomyces xanthii]
MEQPRTRTPQSRPRRTTPLPPQARAGRGGARPAGPGRQAGPAGPAPESATVYRAGAGRARPVPPVLTALRRFPNPRLTGLGSGLFCVGTMLVLGLLDSLLFGSSKAFYGVTFLLVSGLTAGWVRKADLVAGPIAVPIAFAVGVVPIAQGGNGFGAQVMGVVTTLALNAGWLYAGTLVAGVVVLVRRARLNAHREAQRRAAAAAGRRPSQPGQAKAQAPKPRRRTA